LGGGEKGFAALPDRFGVCTQSLRTALPYAKATGVQAPAPDGWHCRCAKNPEAVAAIPRKSVAWGADFLAPEGPDV